MRTNEVAKKVKVHPNTVRLYEDWGFISSVPREANTYRRYSHPSNSNANRSLCFSTRIHSK
ncbi:MerR family DNA-binding transcriptional regulator [Peribacillus sp. NPDC097225]|uniref:MerR family DNA-binding transcriptional regulator n=1 Tax=Peribacillus sp. NPDC097225 TaxID=3364400 RepID=UPI003803008A